MYFGFHLRRPNWLMSVEPLRVAGDAFRRRANSGNVRSSGKQTRRMLINFPEHNA